MFLALGLQCGAAEEETATPNLYGELNPPAVAGVSVVKLEARSAEIEWPANLSSAGTFRTEVRRFAIVDGELQMSWVDFPTAVISRRGEHYRAHLDGLTPQQPYWVRILPEGAAAAAVEPLFAVRFQTPTRVPWITARQATIWGLGGALGVLVWLRWGRRGA